MQHLKYLGLHVVRDLQLEGVLHLEGHGHIVGLRLVSDLDLQRMEGQLCEEQGKTLPKPCDALTGAGGARLTSDDLLHRSNLQLDSTTPGLAVLYLAETESTFQGMVSGCANRRSVDVRGAHMRQFYIPRAA